MIALSPSAAFAVEYPVTKPLEPMHIGTVDPAFQNVGTTQTITSWPMMGRNWRFKGGEWFAENPSHIWDIVRAGPPPYSKSDPYAHPWSANSFFRDVTLDASVPTSSSSFAAMVERHFTYTTNYNLAPGRIGATAPDYRVEIKVGTSTIYVGSIAHHAPKSALGTREFEWASADASMSSHATPATVSGKGRVAIAVIGHEAGDDTWDYDVTIWLVNDAGQEITLVDEDTIAGVLPAAGAKVYVKVGIPGQFMKIYDSGPYTDEPDTAWTSPPTSFQTNGSAHLLHGSTSDTDTVTALETHLTVVDPDDWLETEFTTATPPPASAETSNTVPTTANPADWVDYLWGRTKEWFDPFLDLFWPLETVTGVLS